MQHKNISQIVSVDPEIVQLLIQKLQQLREKVSDSVSHLTQPDFALMSQYLDDLTDPTGRLRQEVEQARIKQLHFSSVPVSLEDFSKEDVRQNFYRYFMPNTPVFTYIKNRECYVYLKESDPNLVGDIENMMSNWFATSTNNTLIMPPALINKLYEAYLKMWNSPGEYTHGEFCG